VTIPGARAYAGSNSHVSNLTMSGWHELDLSRKSSFVAFFVQYDLLTRSGMSAPGQNAKNSERAEDFRFTPESGHRSDCAV
jgi:hypothetical protein